MPLQTFTLEKLIPGQAYDLPCFIHLFDGHDRDAEFLLEGRYPICRECADPAIFKRRLPDENHID